MYNGCKITKTLSFDIRKEKWLETFVKTLCDNAEDITSANKCNFLQANQNQTLIVNDEDEIHGHIDVCTNNAFDRIRQII